jgi:S1-C subfamily serine protease
MFFEAQKVTPDDEKNVLDIIEKVSKSVVNISTVKLDTTYFYQAVGNTLIFAILTS